MRVKLPLPHQKDRIINRERVEHTKSRMIVYDKKAKQHQFSVGDRVIVMQARKNKLTPVYDPRPMTITDIKESMITAERDGWTIVRDASKFKKISLPQAQSGSDSGSEEESHESISDNPTVTEAEQGPTASDPSKALQHLTPSNDRYRADPIDPESPLIDIKASGSNSARH